MRDEAPPDLTPEDLRRRHALAAQIEAYVQPYLARNPRAKRAVDALFPASSVPDESESRVWDHLAFRSFDCVDGGLRAVARVFEKHGYTYRGSLTFSEKKVDAAWFAPPDAPWARDARGDPLFPRLFVSHLRVADLADEKAKAVIVERVSGFSHARDTNDDEEDDGVAERGGVPWREKIAVAEDGASRVSRLSLEEYDTVSRASEYAAWTLINGHALNHVAVPVHRLFVDGREAKQKRKTARPRRRFASLETCLAFLKAPPPAPLSRAGGKSRCPRTGACARPRPSRTTSSSSFGVLAEKKRTEKKRKRRRKRSFPRRTSSSWTGFRRRDIRTRTPATRASITFPSACSGTASRRPTRTPFSSPRSERREPVWARRRAIRGYGVD